MVTFKDREVQGVWTHRFVIACPLFNPVLLPEGEGAEKARREVRTAAVVARVATKMAAKPMNQPGAPSAKARTSVRVSPVT